MAYQAPSLRRRLTCALYELLPLLALWIITLLPLMPLLQAMTPAVTRPLTQIVLLAVAWAYFAYFWRHGQTLAMKTWRIRLVALDGNPPSLRQVNLRYLYACLNLVLLGVGWWSAVRDADRQFLHDRLAGTRLIMG